MTRSKLIAVFAWIQLILSIAIAVTVIWGYTTYQASLGQFAQSVAASITAVSNVVGRTAETLEAKQSLLDQTSKTILAARNLIKELRIVTENQAKIAPQYAEGVRGASALVSSLGGTVQSLGEGMMFTAPAGIEWHGMKPYIITSRPLEKQARAVKTHAQNIKAVGESLLNVSVTIGRDGKNLSLAFMATSEQALKLLEETESTLGRLKSSDLPKALVDLKETSENLRNVSKQVNIEGNIGKVLLIIGLLLAAWCFFNSLSTLMLVNYRM